VTSGQCSPPETPGRERQLFNSRSQHPVTVTVYADPAHPMLLTVFQVANEPPTNDQRMIT